MRAISGDFHFYADPITKSRYWIFDPREFSDVVNSFNIDAELTSLLITPVTILVLWVRVVRLIFFVQ